MKSTTMTPHDPERETREETEEVNPALTLKGAGGVPGVDRLGPWFRNTSTFLREVNGEFKKVTWPTRKQVAIETVVVILVCAFLVGVVVAYDWVFAFGANSVFYGQ